MDSHPVLADLKGSEPLEALAIGDSIAARFSWLQPLALTSDRRLISLGCSIEGFDDATAREINAFVAGYIAGMAATKGGK